MLSHLQLSVNGIDQRISKMEQKGGDKDMNYNLIENLIPFNDLEDISLFDDLLKTNKDVTDQFVSIIA